MTSPRPGHSCWAESAGFTRSSVGSSTALPAVVWGAVSWLALESLSRGVHHPDFQVFPQSLIYTVSLLVFTIAMRLFTLENSFFVISLDLARKGRLWYELDAFSEDWRAAPRSWR